MEMHDPRGQADQTYGYVAEGTDSVGLGRSSEQKPAVRQEFRDMKEKSKFLRSIEYADEAEEFIKKEMPGYYVNCYKQVRVRLNKKRQRAVPGYHQKPWKLPRALQQWQHNITANEGRPSVLLLVGSYKTGKTEWAKSFGRPVEMTQKFDPNAFANDSTHLVMNDIVWGVRAYSGPWEEILSCKESFEMKCKGRKNKKTVTFGKPVIVTSNSDNDPRKNSLVAELFKGKHVVVVELKKNKLLF
ncbi:hypothetical protein MCOR25_007013 [Pyricularia grisea]|nr:hypothetical protein MCOR25_007013 [Pyricularia grisea]